MKTTLLLFAMLICLPCLVKAQVSNLSIGSASFGTIYIELFGSNSCTGTSSTGIIAINGPMSNQYYTPNSFTWTPSQPNFFDFVRIYDADPSVCSNASYIDIGEACMSLPNTDAIIMLDNQCRKPCSNCQQYMDWSTGHNEAALELN